VQNGDKADNKTLVVGQHYVTNRVVDDDPEWLYPYRSHSEAEGFEVETYTDGQHS
jgi:hypothetical protein